MAESDSVEADESSIEEEDEVVESVEADESSVEEEDEVVESLSVR